MYVGARVACDGEFATVKYIGQIESLEGLWLGVEWDNPERGKHSGQYNGVKYFETDVPSAGSFIRSTRASLGICCPEAIRRKYGKKETEEEIIDLPQKSGKQRVIEMVGFQKISGKQSQFHKLNEIVVSSMLVNGPGCSGELYDLVPNAISLDLSSSLLCTWIDVSYIVEQLPNLQSLMLSKNRLKFVENEVGRKAFNQLKSLVLNSMGYNWSDILSCATMWPLIQLLSLCNNRISSLEEPPMPLFSSLSYLDLQGNSINCWQEILKLGKLPCLEQLHLDDTKLESIEFPDVGPTEKSELFPNLHSLSVRGNKLSRWKDIGELNKLRSLNELKATNNPVMFDTDIATTRQLIIAKISGIKFVNRTEVSRSERRGAEIDYIKRYYSEWLASGGKKVIEVCDLASEFLSNHPTYIYLLQKHGASESSEVTPQTNAVKNALLTIEIFSSLLPNKKPIVKRLPDSMPVRRVKGLIQRSFNVAVEDMKLFCLSASDSACRTDMDNDLRPLSFYSISNGDKIDVLW